MEGEEDEKPPCLKPTILDDIIAKMKDSVRKVVAQQMQFPEEYIKEYDKFIYLIDGKAESDVDSYIEEEHDFEELSEKVTFFDNLITANIRQARE